MSKAAMARRKKMLTPATPTRDAWLCGYAAALAAVHRLYHEAQIVESVITVSRIEVDTAERTAARC